MTWPEGALLTLATMVVITIGVVGPMSLVSDVARGRTPWGLRGLSRRYAAWRTSTSTSQPIPPQLLGLELRRLGHELARVEASDVPAKAARMRASQAAYDYVLLEYCRRLDLPTPQQRVPLSPSERFDAEASLIAAGHDW